MDLKLRDKVVIVTGGGEGIGRAVTLELAHEGAIPVVFTRSPLDEGMIGELDAADCTHALELLDLRDEKACRDAVQRTLGVFGHIDGLVNNAGLNDGVGLDAGPDAFVESLRNNVVHYYLMMHLCHQALIASRGAVVNVASKTALTGQGYTSGYCASKGAQLSLTREWAAELADKGVRVNAVVPAEVATPQYTRWLTTFDDPDAARQRIESHIPFGQRMTTPEEVADAVLFLLSSRSSHTTGQWFVPDGGYVHLDRALT